jgi:hypothetical protein
LVLTFFSPANHEEAASVFEGVGQNHISFYNEKRRLGKVQAKLRPSIARKGAPRRRVVLT